jgi:hypothetical protein
MNLSSNFSGHFSSLRGNKLSKKKFMSDFFFPTSTQFLISVRAFGNCFSWQMDLIHLLFLGGKGFFFNN